MIRTVYLFVFCIFLCYSPGIFALTPIKVACVGNSITYGAGIQNRELNSYPAQLGAYLGSGYEVKNFGVSGTTMLRQGTFPYMSTDAYRKSLEYQPDIVFIKLGTNDANPRNRIHLAQFKQDYLQLIDAYRKLSSNPRIILLTPVRSYFQGEEIRNDSIMRSAVISVIHEIAYEQKLELINLYHLFGDRWEEHMMPDRLHPSAIGAGKMAAKLYACLATPTVAEMDVVSAFSLKPVRKFNFHGYQGYEYDYNGIMYYIVQPRRVAVGNPWIWRARFWGHEPQTDIDLLERGFHLTYCDVAGLYGSPEAVKRWNTFYKLAVKAGLNKKVVLEGMSRGGLIVYNWAIANPDKVACIYGDAPVLDFKSWPMGEGNSDRSETDTKQLFSTYGFSSEKEALAWKKNPVDRVSRLVRAKIPMLMVVGDADVVVPVAENTGKFTERLGKDYSRLKVIHKPGQGHHPHSLNNPAPIVDFILKATGQAENMCVHPVCGNEFRSGAGWAKGADWHTVEQDIKATLSGKKLKLLMLGNSITQGLGGNRKLVTYKPGKKAMDDALGKDCWESAGISGDRTQNLLWRLKYGQYNDCHPENAILTIGINNVVPGDEPADIVEGIKACAEEAHRQMPDTRIILLGVLPAGKEKNSKNRVACDQIHELLSRTTFKGAEYVDPTAWFVHPDGELRTELYGGDYLHLNAEGYREWCEQIVRLIGNN